MRANCKFEIIIQIFQILCCSILYGEPNSLDKQNKIASRSHQFLPVHSITTMVMNDHDNNMIAAAHQARAGLSVFL